MKPQAAHARQAASRLESTPPRPAEPSPVLLTVPAISAAAFRKITALLHRTSGIQLRSGKEELVRSRLWRRVRDLGLSGFDAYAGLLESESGPAELPALLDALTTNETSFFREPGHLAFLASRLQETGSREREVVIWSAGCSSGQEPYSIAISAIEALRGHRAPPIRILGTDLSTRVLQRARRASYSERDLARVPLPLRSRYFLPSIRPGSSGFTPVPAVRQLVRFARLNLVERWPIRGPFDYVFCRNVMIYFDAETQISLLARFREILRPGGLLFVGHAESLAGRAGPLAYVQPGVYER